MTCVTFPEHVLLVAALKFFAKILISAVYTHPLVKDSPSQPKQITIYESLFATDIKSCLTIFHGSRSQSG